MSTYDGFIFNGVGGEINLRSLPNFENLAQAYFIKSNCYSANSNIVLLQNCLVPRRFICEKGRVNTAFINSLSLVTENSDPSINFNDILNCVPN